jgi:hypothetical protein
MSWLDGYDWGSGRKPAMESRGGRKVMNRFLDHDHCERRVRSEGVKRKSREKTRDGKWFVCGEAREGTRGNCSGATGDDY